LTGQIIWPAAVFLSEYDLLLPRKNCRYIVKNREHFKNKNIVELGAGAGLSGFVAANFGIEILWCCDIV